VIWILAFVVLSYGGAEYGYNMGKDNPRHDSVIGAIVEGK
jgi:hypothetical protein